MIPTTISTTIIAEIRIVPTRFCHWPLIPAPPTNSHQYSPAERTHAIAQDQAGRAFVRARTEIMFYFRRGGSPCWKCVVKRLE
jgi:hypothetical protein